MQFIYNENKEVIVEKTDENLKRLIRSFDLWASECTQEKTWYHYASDEQGSIIFVADENEIKNRYEYDAFGNAVICEEKVENRYRYTGQQYDQVTQQYYLRARYYNPVIARFTQEDAYRGDGLNLYAYCDNNPAMYYDPSGYCGESKDPLKPSNKSANNSDRNNNSPNNRSANTDGTNNSSKNRNNGNGLTGNNWTYNAEKDVDLRGTGTTYQTALDEAFKRTGIPRSDFEVTKWGTNEYGKSIPVEWRPKPGVSGANGACVNMDIPKWNNVKPDGTLGEGPHQPHIGYQTPGKGSDRIRGHIFVDEIPATRR